MLKCPAVYMAHYLTHCTDLLRLVDSYSGAEGWDLDPSVGEIAVGNSTFEIGFFL